MQILFWSDLWAPPAILGFFPGPASLVYVCVRVCVCVCVSNNPKVGWMGWLLASGVGPRYHQWLPPAPSKQTLTPLLYCQVSRCPWVLKLSPDLSIHFWLPLPHSIPLHSTHGPMGSTSPEGSCGPWGWRLLTTLANVVGRESEGDRDLRDGGSQGCWPGRGW